ncbi:hypothetical protein F7725_009682 [Dissostichus mawsoni]|uniref:Uncharacterized protein n=1 Tax=Dissostichus mawsoni TaxID=36200 RepID=A0A7J5XLF8_DISMA|nr:hypothetical protein F7725_009682 [Dissostichus mawsoni]
MVKNIYTYSSSTLCAMLQQLCKGLSGESRRDDLELFKGAQEVQGVKCGNTDRSWPVSTLKEDFQVGGPLLLASIVGGVVSLLSSALRLSAAEKTRMRQSFFEAQEEDMRKECSVRRTSTLDDWKPSVGGDVTV